MKVLVAMNVLPDDWDFILCRWVHVPFVPRVGEKMCFPPVDEKRVEGIVCEVAFIVDRFGKSKVMVSVQNDYPWNDHEDESYQRRMVLNGWLEDDWKKMLDRSSG